MDFFDFIKNNKFIILIISIFMNIIFMFTSIYFAYNYYNHECVSDNKNLSQIVSDENTFESENFYVEIKGAVEKPGVYAANSNNIINDIVKLAGGFTKKAYTNNINLSRKVSDEMVIYVYSKTEYSKKSKEEKIEQIICECPSYEIDNCTDNLVSEIIVNDNNSNNTNTSRNEDKIIVNDNSSDNKDDLKKEDEIIQNDNNFENKLININTASKEELMNLSGIGESKAIAIIEYRTNTSLFKTIEDIKNVSGIGEALFEKIKDSITV